MEIFLNKEEFSILLVILVLVYIFCLIRYVQIIFAPVSTMYPVWERVSYLVANIVITVMFITVLINHATFNKPIDLSNYVVRVYEHKNINDNAVYQNANALDISTGEIYEISNDNISRMQYCKNKQAYIEKRYDAITIFFVKVYGLLEKETITIECKKEK